VADGGPNEQANQAQAILARQSAGFLPAKELIDQAVKLRAEQVMLDYAATGVGVKYQIDGVWHPHKPLERAQGDPMLEVFKTLTYLKPADRVTKQAGKFGAELNGQKYACRFQSQGTPTGEAAVIAFEQKKLSFKTLDELGMRGKMQEQLQEIVGAKSGFVLVTAMPGGGLTTTFDVLLGSTDRFMRNFVAVEDQAKAEREIENVAVTHYNAKGGETPVDVLPRLIRTYPDVFVVRDLSNAATIDLLCDQVQEERLVFGTIRAKEATEALLRVLMHKPDVEKFAKSITAVLNVRLVRKLCDHCKEAYPPPPEVLKQLGLPPGKVQAFYRPPVPPPPESEAAKQYKPCEACSAIGYFGRTALFELLTINDTMRQILVKSPKLDLLREAAKKAGHRTLQDEGILLLVRGITSVPELVRVLKQ
jgi:type II secretory ATPase GspE/PulE/Tfp pilus assembly ATPase PilB-like protein